MKTPVLYIVIPCYNEEKVLPITSVEFLKKINELESNGMISSQSRILFVNDGSKDSTWNIIKDLSKKMNTILEFRRAVTGDIRMQFWQVLWKRRISVILRFRLTVTDRMISMR